MPKGSTKSPKAGPPHSGEADGNEENNEDCRGPPGQRAKADLLEETKKLQAWVRANIKGARVEPLAEVTSRALEAVRACFEDLKTDFASTDFPQPKRKCDTEEGEAGEGDQTEEGHGKTSSKGRGGCGKCSGRKALKTR